MTIHSGSNFLKSFCIFESNLADAGIAGQPVRSNFQVDALVISKGLRLSESIATDFFWDICSR